MTPSAAEEIVKPLAIDLFCGLGGWAEGFLAEGYRVIGYDIEAHDYGTGGYPGELVLRDVRSITGAECKDAAVIVASPPCQAYSYRAMPWKRAKALPPPDNTLFDECFRIQREASEAAGRYIPLIVENVRGAQKWVGRAQWNYGSFYLWGDVPALMPMTLRRHTKTVGLVNIRDGHSHTRHLTNQAEHDAIKNNGGSWFAIAHNTNSGNKRNPVHYPDEQGRKVSGDWFGSYADMKAAGTISPGRLHRKNSIKRKAASAMIAKIPYPLAVHIARVFKPAAAQRIQEGR